MLVTRILALGWTFEAWVVVPLAIMAALYACGFRRARARAGRGRIFNGLHAVSFAAGLLSLILALISPLDELAEQIFSAHMVQHLLLMLAAAPLLVASRAGLAFLWAFDAPSRRRIGRIWRSTGFGPLVAFLMRPLIAWIAFCGIFVFWHLPGPYEWALGSEWIHALEHMSFLFSACLFWSVVIGPIGGTRLDYGSTLLYVGTMAVLSGLPGALMILAPKPLYTGHAATVGAWGLTLIQDQQLAGLIMWIPAGAVYLGTMIWLFAKWLDDSEIDRTPLHRAASLAWLLIFLLPLTGCNPASNQAKAAEKIGDAARGASRIAAEGCGACHTIPGIGGADALVGPPLTHFSRRVYIAGMLQNTPDNLVTWIRHPQQVVPGNAMPDMGINEKDARDIAAYLTSIQ